MNKEMIKTIVIIADRLNSNDIKWALVGSANLNLQGIDIQPCDLDIAVEFESLRKISEIFSDYSASEVKELESLSNKKAWEVTANINNFEVQFNGSVGEDVYTSKLLANKVKIISLDGIDVPCFTLEAESQVYKETGRENKSRLIESF